MLDKDFFSGYENSVLESYDSPGGISGKMIDIIRLFITKKPVNGFQIRQINIYAFGTVSQIFLITAGEIIDTDNIISLSQQMTREIAS